VPAGANSSCGSVVRFLVDHAPPQLLVVLVPPGLPASELSAAPDVSPLATVESVHDVQREAGSTHGRTAWATRRVLVVVQELEELDQRWAWWVSAGSLGARSCS
jgi:hypothetical protein